MRANNNRPYKGAMKRGMSVTAREAALRTLAAQRKSGAWSETYLSNLIEKEHMDPRDAALAAKICYGVLQNMTLCDYYISAYSTVKPAKMEPMVLDILRLSVYQIAFLTKIPHSAAVNEGVALVKKYANPGAAGLVNAVLRKISANTENLPLPPKNDFREYLSIIYSHPLWLVNEFCDSLGEAEAERLLAANNGHVPTTAQVNTLKATAEEVTDKLTAAGVSVKAHPWLPDCLELSDTGSIGELKAFMDGEIIIQDAAARLAVIAAAPEPGTAVLDACAAPGGKSFAAAMLMENRGSILSCDIHEKKLGQIAEGARRLGIDIIQTRARDAKSFSNELAEAFHTVIADVPCSGMGIIRKKPDIRYKDPARLEELPQVQLKILSNLSKYVMPGGALLYSTCTVLDRENRGLVTGFLENHPEFKAEEFSLPGHIGRVETGMITLLPHIHGTDGFFICKLRKKL